MDVVAMDGQGRDFQVVLFKSGLQLIDLRGIGQELCGFAMGISGITAAADFHGLHALFGEIFACLVKGLVLKQNGKNAEFHKK